MDTHAIKLVVHNFWADANARVDLKMHLLRKQRIHLWSWMYLENLIMLMGECKGLGWKLLNSTIKRCCPLLLSLQCIFFLVLYTIENVRLPQVLSLWHCQRSLTVIKQQSLIILVCFMLLVLGPCVTLSFAMDSLMINSSLDYKRGFEWFKINLCFYKNCELINITKISELRIWTAINWSHNYD